MQVAKGQQVLRQFGQHILHFGFLHMLAGQKNEPSIPQAREESPIGLAKQPSRPIPHHRLATVAAGNDEHNPTVPVLRRSGNRHAPPSRTTLPSGANCIHVRLGAQTERMPKGFRRTGLASLFANGLVVLRGFHGGPRTPSRRSGAGVPCGDDASGWPGHCGWPCERENQVCACV